MTAIRHRYTGFLALGLCTFLIGCGGSSEKSGNTVSVVPATNAPQILDDGTEVAAVASVPTMTVSLPAVMKIRDRLTLSISEEDNFKTQWLYVAVIEDQNFDGTRAFCGVGFRLLPGANHQTVSDAYASIEGTTLTSFDSIDYQGRAGFETVFSEQRFGSTLTTVARGFYFDAQGDGIELDSFYYFACSGYEQFFNQYRDEFDRVFASVRFSGYGRSQP